VAARPVVERGGALAASNDDEEFGRRVRVEAEGGAGGGAGEGRNLGADGEAGFALFAGPDGGDADAGRQINALREAGKVADGPAWHAVGFVQRHGHAMEAGGNDDAGRRESAEAYDNRRPVAADEAQPGKEGAGLRGHEAQEPHGRKRERRSGDFFKREVRVFGKQAGVDLLVADEQEGAVAARKEAFG
jgi:hypothetical protein